MGKFVINSRTELINEIQLRTAVECACARFKRDMEMALCVTEEGGGVIQRRQKEMETESY